jgi:hypothetical protein
MAFALPAGRLSSLLPLPCPLGRQSSLLEAVLGPGQCLVGCGALDAALLAVELEIAAVALQPLRSQLDDPIHPRKQGPVVADDDQPLPPSRHQLVDEPPGRAVEMVCRLVEDQEVGLLEQERGEADARHLAVAQAGDRLRQPDVRYAQPRERALDSLRQVPTVFEQLEIAGGRVSPRDMLVRRERRRQSERVGHQRTGAEARDLREIRHPRRAGHRPGGRRPASDEDLEQRRLADAVGAHQARTHRGEAEGEGRKEAGAVRQAAADIDHAEMRRHGMSSLTVGTD